MFKLLNSSVPIVLNTGVWSAIAFSAGWWHRRTPAADLEDDNRFLRLRPFETDGSWYEERLRIKAWKNRLPETGGHHGGMSKRRLPGRSTNDLARFAAECRRGERTHWTIVAASPAFALWNTHDAFIAITAANLVANCPFIAILRYNRARIVAILYRSAITL